MNPWECPRCHAINAPHVGQCTCKPTAGIGLIPGGTVPVPHVPSPTVQPMQWPAAPWIGITAGQFATCAAPQVWTSSEWFER